MNSSNRSFTVHISLLEKFEEYAKTVVTMRTGVVNNVLTPCTSRPCCFNRFLTKAECKILNYGLHRRYGFHQRC